MPPRKKKAPVVISAPQLAMEFYMTGPKHDGVHVKSYADGLSEYQRHQLRFMLRKMAEELETE